MAKKQQSDEQLYRVREGFAVPGEGGYLNAYTVGQLLRADDPLVKTHGALLEPASNKAVEAATAAPGERRSLRLPGGTTVEGATRFHASHADQNRIPRNFPKESDMVHNLPPSDPRSPASEFAAAQPAAGVVAPDVPPEQNLAGGPKPDEVKTSEVEDYVASQEEAGTRPGEAHGGPPVTDGETTETDETDGAFDPGSHTVEQVNAHLDTVDDSERERILQAERDGKGRTGIVG